MKLYNDLLLRFENSDWSKNPEFGVIDTILELHPEIYNISNLILLEMRRLLIFSRKDTPSLEQIVRAAIFKEMKGYDYRELEYMHKSPIEVLVFNFAHNPLFHQSTVAVAVLFGERVMVIELEELKSGYP